MTNVHSIDLGGVDLSGFVTGTLDVELSPWQHATLDRLPTRTITVSGFWQAPRTSSRLGWAHWHAYQAWRANRRARLARMRTAYRRRHR